MSLKELTWENHKKAERKVFAGKLISGKMSPDLYYKYLTNQFYNYVVLENALRECGFDPELYSVFRANKMREDLLELEKMYFLCYSGSLITPSTAEYSGYIERLLAARDIHALTAHMYVRHFGDMYGGAIIAQRCPGLGRMYHFDDKETLKTRLRELLTDDMADEANRCFEFAIRLFEELSDEPDLG